MKKIRYSEWSLDDWDDLALGDLLEQLSDFLLQSGFQQQTQSRLKSSQQAGADEFEGALDDIRRAIAQALLDSTLLDEDQWRSLFEADGTPKHEKIAALVERLLAELLKEGLLNVRGEGAEVDWWIEQDEHGRPKRVRIRPTEESGRTEDFVRPQLRFEVTTKGADFLGYKSLQRLLGGFGHAAFGRHQTDRLATGIEAFEASKDYEFGDALNLDASATLCSAIAREGIGLPLNLEPHDLKVRQGTYESSCATVLMLDCSHSMILYGEDRFTPAKQVTLALAHLIRTQYRGDSLRLVLFHDAAEEVSLQQLPGVQVGPYHTNTCEGLKLARRILLAQKTDMRQIIMITDGKPSAIFLDEDQFGRKAHSDRGRRLYKNSFGLDPVIVNQTLAEAAQCRRAGIMINTFMLTSDYYLVQFVQELTAVAHGKAYVTDLEHLGQFVMFDFLRRKTQLVR